MAKLDSPFMIALDLLPGMDGTGSLFDPLLEAPAGKIMVAVVREMLTFLRGRAADRAAVHGTYHWIADLMSALAERTKLQTRIDAT